MSDLTAQRLEPGDRLDRYELLCPIALGGMASVWLARQHGKHGFEKLVAVKTILPLYAADLRFQQMFLDEARIAAGIEHPNVAQILDLGEDADVLYLAMEWVDGDSLSKLFRASERQGELLPVAVVCRIIADTCAGLHAAHELQDKNGELLNVVHRDVSPQNILVSTKGQAKLIDFGIAKARDRVSENTSTGALKGKVHYMAPEQALGRPVDRRADVWAIGAVLYHMLAGVPPFEGPNQLATLHLLTTDTDPAPLPSHVPPQVVEVMRSALVRDVERRCPTAEELQRRLEGAMVASGHTALLADVAAFVSQQLTERVDARRKAVNLALEAARQRQKLQQMLAPAEDSGARARMTVRRARRVLTSAVTPLAGEEVTSSATLGSAAVVSTQGDVPARTKQIAIAGSVLGVCALLAAMAVGMAVAKRTGQVVAAAPASVAQAAPTRDIPPPPPLEPTVREPAPSVTAAPAGTASVTRPVATSSARAASSKEPGPGS